MNNFENLTNSLNQPEKNEQLDQNIEIREALDDLKSKLDSLHNNIKKNLTSQEKENLESFVDDLLSIEKNNDELKNIKEKLELNKGLEKNDIETVKNVVENFYSDIDNLEEKEKNIIIKASKENLFELQQQIDPRKKLKKEILGKSKDASLFGIGLFSAGSMIEDIMNYFEEKYTGERENKEEGGLLSKLGLDFNFDEIWVKMKLGMLSMFAPEIYKKIQNYEQLLSGGASKIMDEARETGESNELSDQQIEKLGGEIKPYIKDIMSKVDPSVKEKDKKYDIFFSEWWGKVSSKEMKIKGGFENLLQNLKKGKIEDINQLMEILGFGSIAVMDFISLGYKHDIIDISNLIVETGKEALKTGAEVAYQSVMFAPKLVGMTFGMVSLDEVLGFLKERDYMPDEYKTPILVMIYKGLDTKAGWLLKELAALPGYGISFAAGQMGENISRLSIGLEALGNAKIEKRLNVLTKIERELGVESGLYQKLSESFQSYKKGIALSSAFGTAKNYNDFINKLTSIKDDNGARIFTDAEIKNIKYMQNTDGFKLMDLGDDFKKKGSSIINEQIKNYGNSISKMKHRGYEITEGASRFLKGSFSKGEFVQNLSENLSESLYKNAKLFSTERIWDQNVLKPYYALQEGFETAKIGGKIEMSTLMKKEPDALGKIKSLARQSPEALKFLFGEFPVILLAKEQFVEIAKEIKERDFSGAGKEVFQIFAYLTPILGPVTFMLDKEEDVEIAGVGVGTIWLCIDGAMLLPAIRSGNIQSIGEQFKYGPRAAKNLFKLSSQGTVAFYEVGKDAIKSLRSGKSFLRTIAQSTRGKKGKMAVAVATVITLGYTVNEIHDIFDVQAEELQKEIDAVKQAGGNLENYIRENRENEKFGEEEKKYIVKFTMMNYLPIQNPESITEVEFTETQEKGKKEDLIKVYMPNSVLKNMPEGMLQENMERFKQIFGSSIEVRSEDDINLWDKFIA